MDALTLKKMVAKAALTYVQPGTVLGVGTGSTVDCFIDALAESGLQLKGAVSSSVRSEKKLREIGVPIVDMNDVESLSIYVDGADEVDPANCLIKGGGGANTREKIVADISDKFVCIADQSKLVQVLGAFPLPVEVLPMASNAIARKLTALGGQVKVREGFITDNGNVILDVAGLKITDPVAMEKEINHWPGVVTNGLFAIRKADVVLIATADGIKTL
ncbi:MULTISPECIES: ribose-5-phosphate isomerase RpiA [unclassified Limnobacter]|jgi:ribose 5-phosphate isomerase A|uniref:ribose-5-phosphate isomerase RpiA n=1 Tax=unclassified Limnobacter TaxID=2630203 RepID=UPI000156C31A|nr:MULTISPECIES: ribose-5-phosphate isomerase RpiA [unclassified Limnobacter]EDM83632.1 ribose 5-phosphate isomerase [Limnobacter sp. MED105]